MIEVTNRYTGEKYIIEKVFHVSINFTIIEHDRYTVTGTIGLNTVTIPITYEEFLKIAKEIKK